MSTTLCENVNHYESREKEIQLLIKGILECMPDFIAYQNGQYEWTCPLCYASIAGCGGANYDMEEIFHETSCPYLIAKGLIK